MFDLEKLAKLRFGMSEVPKLGGQPGNYEERWSQWFLERSFFRDFVYRNPRGKKKGEELADAVVLFGDVVLMVQVKAQCGKHDPIAWAAEKLLDAFKQLCKTHTTLVGGQVKKLRNDYYGDVAFDPKEYPNRVGLIILAQDSDPYIAGELVPEILTADFPVHVFSLKDFAMVASRFDTAGDLITFLEMRGDVASREQLSVHSEPLNIQKMLPHVEAVLRNHMSPTSDEILDKTVQAFERAATGTVLESPEWRYGLAIDDMIARAHEVDPGLPWNKDDGSGAIRVAQFLGWLTRERRIKLGKRIIAACEAARDDGNVHYFPHVQPSRGTTCVYLITPQSRSDRVQTLEFLMSYAQMKYGVQQCLGVATEPIGSGRSYDFIVQRRPLPSAVLQQLKAFDDPFSATLPL